MLAAIETDKAVVDFEMQEEGYVAALLFDAGAKDVPLGAAVAIIVENKDDVAAFANYDPSGASEAPSPSPAAASEAPAASQAAAPSAPAQSYPEHIALEMPNLSPTMEKVSVEMIPKWPFGVGGKLTRRLGQMAERNKNANPRALSHRAFN